MKHEYTSLFELIENMVFAMLKTTFTFPLLKSEQKIFVPSLSLEFILLIR